MTLIGAFFDETGKSISDSTKRDLTSYLYKKVLALLRIGEKCILLSGEQDLENQTRDP